MISRAGFFGRGVFKNVAADLILNHREARGYAIKALVVQQIVLPDARKTPLGGPVFILYNIAGSSKLKLLDVARNIILDPWNANTVLELYLVEAKTPEGVWIIKVRVGGTTTGVGLRDRLFIANGAFPSTLSIYSPAPNTWAAGPTGPQHSEGCAFVLGDSMFLVGDFPTSGVPLSTSEYNAPIATWITRANTPSQVARSCAAASYRRNFGEVYGGAGTFPLTTLRYTRQNPGFTHGLGLWTSWSAAPIAKTRCSAAMVDGLERVIVMGGEPEPTPNLARNVATDTWWTVANHVSPFRHSIATFVINGLVYAVGGRTEIVPITRFQQVDEYNPATDTWVARAALSLGARWGGAGVGTNGAGFYLAGRDNADVASNACVRYQVDTWSNIGNMNVARAEINNHGVAIL